MTAADIWDKFFWSLLLAIFVMLLWLGLIDLAIPFMWLGLIVTVAVSFGNFVRLLARLRRRERQEALRARLKYQGEEN